MCPSKPSSIYWNEAVGDIGDGPRCIKHELVGFGIVGILYMEKSPEVNPIDR